jgi:hypothetical protein
MKVSLETCRMRTSPLRCGLLIVVVGIAACHQKSEAPHVAPAVPSSIAQPVLSTEETAPEKSCHTFVQEFYDWYFDRLNSEDGARKNSPTAEQEVLNRKQPVLALSLRQMLREDSEAQAHSNDIVGLDFDPYINAQDWNGKYKVQRAEVKDATCRAILYGDDAGTQVEMVDPELQNIDGTWIFVNFHYPNAYKPVDENLISVLKMLREERQKHRAEATHK